MILAARPADGESAPFLELWIVGQAYTLTAMVCAVIGLTIMNSTLAIPSGLRLARGFAAVLAVGAGRRRLRFADHRAAAQALENVEFHLVIP